jgi:uncharacterized repeat protein (TIGR03803 family)
MFKARKASATNSHQANRLFLISALFLIFGAASVSAQDIVVITNLVSFNQTNGRYPTGPLLQANDGNIYGTTLYGGDSTANAGEVFQVTTSGQFTNLVLFNITNGSNPNFGVIQGVDGNLYGTTTYGGAYVAEDTNHYGFGTIFKLSTNGVFSTVASFDGTDGKSAAELLETSPGVFYGTANSGGAYTNALGFGYGTIFTVDTNGALNSFLSFQDTNGASPSAGLTMTTNGVLFGTTTSGGAYEVGIAFRLASDGSISAEATFNFTNGGVPGAMVVGRDGNLYGPTLYGGTNSYGSIFKLTTNMVLTTFFNFDGTNGNAPTALIVGADGNFYGVTGEGGAYGSGNVFELSTNGVLTSLYDFTGGSDGSVGESLIQGKDGSFYGTTYDGGDLALGNIFKLTIIQPPTIQSVSQAAHSITFTWNAAPSFTYDVQFSTNLASTNWSLLQSIVASNTVETITDSTLTNQQRFYRISLQR